MTPALAGRTYAEELALLQERIECPPKPPRIIDQDGPQLSAGKAGDDVLGASLCQRRMNVGTTLKFV